MHQPGERLPRQHDMAKEYGVAFSTLKQALDLLESEGYVLRKVGQGTYATLPEDRVPVALVITDDQTTREVFARALPSNGWKSIAAKSSLEALEELAERPIDLILVDLQMSGTNEAETFRKIRQANPRAHLVILMGDLSSLSMSDMAEASESGPIGVMKKPCALEDIRMVLGVYTNPRRLGVG